jgi:hypothetical protein
MEPAISPPTLEELDIPKQQSYRWRPEAEISEERLEHSIAGSDPVSTTFVPMVQIATEQPDRKDEQDHTTHHQEKTSPAEGAPLGPKGGNLGPNLNNLRPNRGSIERCDEIWGSQYHKSNGNEKRQDAYCESGRHQSLRHRTPALLSDSSTFYQWSGQDATDSIILC